MDVSAAREIVAAIMVEDGAPPTARLRLEAHGSSTWAERLGLFFDWDPDVDDGPACDERRARDAFEALDGEVIWAFWRAQETEFRPPLDGVAGEAVRCLRDLARNDVDAHARNDHAMPVLDLEPDDDIEPEESLERTEESRAWESFGGYEPRLRTVMEQYLHGPTEEERLHAFNKLDKYRRLASEGNHADVMSFLRPAESRRTRIEELRGGFGSTAARRSRAGAEAAFKAWATAHGWDPIALAAPNKAGRPSDAERRRMDTLADAVRACRGKGYTQDAIGDAIGRDKRRVAELERRPAETRTS